MNQSRPTLLVLHEGLERPAGQSARLVIWGLVGSGVSAKTIRRQVVWLSVRALRGSDVVVSAVPCRL